MVEVYNLLTVVCELGFIRQTMRVMWEQEIEKEDDESDVGTRDRKGR